MAVTLGSGDFRYEVEEGWGRLPGGWSFREVAAVGVDKKDNVYCFSRGQHPIIVFDRDGNFLRSWGEGTYKRAHGITMGPDDTIYLTDDGDHTVRKCTLEGKVLLTLGIPGKAAPYQSGEPFNRCTHVALSPKNEIFVSDGYGNSRVHKYSPDGKLLLSWASLAAIPGSSTLSIISAPTATAGFTSRTGKIIGCRCLTVTANMRPNGTTCIVRARCTWTPRERMRSATSENLDPV